MEARSTGDILELTFSAWKLLEPKIFQSSWIVCGLVTPEEITSLSALAGRQLGAPVPDLKGAQATLSDFFSKFSKHFTPQFCTRMEWQMQDTLM